jgi:dTDP-4-dehydrorhamnose reductase
MCMGESRGVVIVGADGLIGRSLAQRLEAVNCRVVATSRRSDGGEFLDLAQGVENWTVPKGISLAYLCAAETSMVRCERFPAQTFKVNVSSTVLLARKLVDVGVKVVFLSSNRVFDGTTPFVKAEACHAPCTEYGRQKAEAEIRLLEMGPNAAIVRLTKVFGAGSGLIATWRQALGRREAITPFSDMVMAPVPLQAVVDAIAAIGLSGGGGIYQVSADRDISYEQAALRVAQRIGADPSLIRPIASRDSTVAIEHLPAHTTLDGTRLRDELRIGAPDAWRSIDEACCR